MERAPSPAAVQEEDNLDAPPRAVRHKLKEERMAVTHKFNIGGHEGYIIVGLYPNCEPGEIFIKMAKDTPIDFRQEHPMLQVQPIPRVAYQEATLNNYELVPDLKQFAPEDWDDYYDTVVRPNAMIDRPRGLYAAAARKRRAAEVSGQDKLPGTRDEV